MSIISLIVVGVSSFFSLRIAFDINTYAKNNSMLHDKFLILLHIQLIGTIICAYLFNYEIEQAFHAYFTIFPLITVFKIGMATLVTLGIYVWMIDRFTVLSPPSWLIPLNIIAFFVHSIIVISLYGNIDFYQLQLISMASITVSSLATGIGVYSILVNLEQDDTVGSITHKLYGISQITLFIGMVLILIDAIWKLATGIEIINTPMYAIAEALRMISLIVVVFMNYGEYLAWISYPSKLIIYQRIKRLNASIQQQADVRRVIFDVPLPRPTPKKIDMLIHREYITALDIYQFLPVDSPLRAAIHRINTPRTDYQSNLNALGKLGKQYT